MSHNWHHLRKKFGIKSYHVPKILPNFKNLVRVPESYEALLNSFWRHQIQPAPASNSMPTGSDNRNSFIFGRERRHKLESVLSSCLQRQPPWQTVLQRADVLPTSLGTRILFCVGRLSKRRKTLWKEATRRVMSFGRQHSDTSNTILPSLSVSTPTQTLRSSSSLAQQRCWTQSLQSKEAPTVWVSSGLHSPGHSGVLPHQPALLGRRHQDEWPSSR